MASSYSTDLKLELMVTGENAGTWGDKTNTNLNLLQQAIAGYEAITVNGTGDTALTMSDAALSNARNAVIELTGTITDNITVSIPDGIEKTYIVYNNTTGSFTVQFKTTSGTGPTFTTTDKTYKIVYADGTDVIEVPTAPQDGTITTAKLSDNAVTTAKISDNQITTAKISDNQITGAKISANTIVGSNISTATDVQIDSFGVGTPASGTTGEIRATDDITAFYSSDMALKENIVNIPNPLEAIKKLNGVTFDWRKSYIDERGGEDGYFVRKKDVGVIAQEVEKVLPEAVAQRANGIKAVKYDRLTCLLIEAVKELQEKVDSLIKKGE